MVCRWKSQAASSLQQLQAAVSHILRYNKLPELSTYLAGDGFTASPVASSDSRHASHYENDHDHDDVNGSGSCNGNSNGNSDDSGTGTGTGTGTSTSNGPGPGMDVTREPSQEPDLQDPELVPAPMRSLYEVTKLRNFRNNFVGTPKVTMLEEDFISRGLVSLHEAEELFAYFSRTMNQLLWGGIILVHHDLTSVRRASTLLSAAVLTVAALHIPNRTDTLNRCYGEYVSLVSSMSLSRAHTLDDIRALCVGAFWLSELSWKLSGHAVRIATELGLHQSYQKLIRGHTDQYERAQLWYLLYVCDHHFSIAYGRPPVMHEDVAMKNHETFLQSPIVVAGDVRLLAQVALFMILTEAYRTFGSDTEQPMSEEDFGQLRMYNVAVDQWRLLWQPRSGISPFTQFLVSNAGEKLTGQSRQPICTNLPVERRRPALPLCQIPAQLPLPTSSHPLDDPGLLHGPQGIRQHRHLLRNGLSEHGAGRARRPRRHRRRAHLHPHDGDLLGRLPAQSRRQLELSLPQYRRPAGPSARRACHRADDLRQCRRQASHPPHCPWTHQDARTVRLVGGCMAICYA